MSRSASLILAGILGLAAVSQADLQSDVLTMTGNIRAKMVWVRCEPTASGFAKAPSWYNNYGTQTTLMCYDSDAKTERVLDPTVSQHMDPMVTRSGEYAVWSANDTKKSFIIKWDGTGRRELLSGGQYYVLSCQYDEATRKEYLWTTDAAKSPATNVEHPKFLKVWRVELVNGVADPTKIEAMFDFTGLIAGRPEIWAPFTASCDGKLGIINNHPYITVFEFATKKATSLSIDGGYACWPSMAPDTSRRVTHFNEEHTYLHVFDKYNTTDASKIRWVSIAQQMPGNTDPAGGDDMDATCPRFSNHPTFMSASYPLIAGVDNMDNKHGEFCIGKWTAAYGALTWVKITGAGDTHRDKVGDLWLASGEGPNKSAVAVKGTAAHPRHPGGRISVDSKARSVSFTGSESVTAGIRDAQGRIVAAHTGIGPHTWNFGRQALSEGTYFISTASGNQVSTGRIVICK